MTAFSNTNSISSRILYNSKNYFKRSIVCCMISRFSFDFSKSLTSNIALSLNYVNFLKVNTSNLSFWSFFGDWVIIYFSVIFFAPSILISTCANPFSLFIFTTEELKISWRSYLNEVYLFALESIIWSNWFNLESTLKMFSESCSFLAFTSFLKNSRKPLKDLALFCHSWNNTTFSSSLIS